jgi:hypothetical protein
MKRRRLLLFGLLGLLALLGVGVWMVWSSQSAITVENGDKIRVGMTRAEVEAILGGPEQNETSGWITFDGEGGIILKDKVSPGIWASDRVFIHVTFDDNGLVSDSNCSPCRPARGLADRLLRRWLGL